jgi:hypothetical protein
MDETWTGLAGYGSHADGVRIERGRPESGRKLDRWEEKPTERVLVGTTGEQDATYTVSNDTPIGGPERIIDNATIAAYNSDCKHRIRRASYGR